jgi:hypothetical protein
MIPYAGTCPGQQLLPDSTAATDDEEFLPPHAEVLERVAMAANEKAAFLMRQKRSDKGVPHPGVGIDHRTVREWWVVRSDDDGRHRRGAVERIQYPLIPRLLHAPFIVIEVGEVGVEEHDSRRAARPHVSRPRSERKAADKAALTRTGEQHELVIPEDGPHGNAPFDEGAEQAVDRFPGVIAEPQGDHVAEVHERTRASPGDVGEDHVPRFGVAMQCAEKRLYAQRFLCVAEDDDAAAGPCRRCIGWRDTACLAAARRQVQRHGQGHDKSGGKSSTRSELHADASCAPLEAWR